MIAQILAILAPVALVAAAGLAWDRLRQPFDATLISNLVFYLGAPCLSFTTLTGFALEPGIGPMAAATAAALALFALVGALLLRLWRMPIRTYLPSIMFPNLGNMGLPLALFAFGPHGFALAVVVFTVGSVAHATVGVWIFSGKFSPATLLRTPLLYGALAAIACLATGVQPPDWLTRATGLLGNLSVPLLLMTLGVSLSRLKIANLDRAARLTALRLGVGVGVGVGLAYVFGFTGVTRGVLVLDCAMPTAVFNYLLAEKFGAAPGDIAGAVALSTAVSFLTLPLLLAFLLG